jgi:hypothetical protein
LAGQFRASWSGETSWPVGRSSSKGGSYCGGRRILSGGFCAFGAISTVVTPHHQSLRLPTFAFDNEHPARRQASSTPDVDNWRQPVDNRPAAGYFVAINDD